MIFLGKDFICKIYIIDIILFLSKYALDELSSSCES